MKVQETIERESLNQSQPNTIKMPFGLLGFEQLKEYVLLASPEEAPFLWLESPQDASISFLVISPFVALPHYQPDPRSQTIGHMFYETDTKHPL